MSKRKLALHPSALSESEYDFYTAALNSFLSPEEANDDDLDYTSVRISTREVRAWLRGRYSPPVPGQTIDEIVRTVWRLPQIKKKEVRKNAALTLIISDLPATSLPLRD